MFVRSLSHLLFVLSVQAVYILELAVYLGLIVGLTVCVGGGVGGGKLALKTSVEHNESCMRYQNTLLANITKPMCRASA